MSVLPAVPDSVKDKATDVLLNMVNVTVQTMNDVVDFGKQQIPEVIHQLLMWKALESFIAFAINIIFLFVGVMLITRWGNRFGKAMAARREKARTEYEEGVEWTRFNSCSDATSPAYDFFMAGSIVCRWVLVVVGIIMATGGLNAALESLQWLKILVAPKVYLIEYAAELIKSAKA